MVVTPLERTARAGAHVAGVLGLAFLLLPILVIIPLSFNAEGFFNYPMPGLSLRWYRDIAESEAWRRALVNSLIVGLGTTVIATALGAFAALGIVRLRPRLRGALMAVFMLPIIVPGVVAALAIFLFYAGFGLAGNLYGITLAHVVLGTPFVVITLVSVLGGFDSNLIRAAISLGASPPVAYARVMVPLIAPALVSSALFVFVTSFDEFIVTSFLASPKEYTLPLQMWSGVHDDVTPAILAVATLFIIASAAMLAAVELLRRRMDRLRASRNEAHS